MPRNVEIKARMKDVKKLKVAAKELSGSDGTLIVQEDTFFLAPNGRLKLRQIQVMVSHCEHSYFFSMIHGFYFGVVLFQEWCSPEPGSIPFLQFNSIPIPLIAIPIQFRIR